MCGASSFFAMGAMAHCTLPFAAEAKDVWSLTATALVHLHAKVLWHRDMYIVMTVLR
jgi:hypothetical protein